MNPLTIRLLGAIGLVVALWVSYGFWHHKVWHEGYTAHKSEIAKAVEEGKKQYEKTAIEVQRLPDDALRREFCKWVRDAGMPACLKSLPAFR